MRELKNKDIYMKNDNEKNTTISETKKVSSENETTNENAEKTMTDDEIIDMVAEQVLIRYRKAFEKLAE